ncbi:MAG: tail fiber domain-containing protein [Flavobacterium sp.]
MKNFYNISLCVILFLFSTNSFSQVGIGTTTPNASSALDITSTTAGLLAPRMTQANKTAISAPATGLLIYQTDGTAGFYYYNGSAWVPFGASGWALTGNSGTAPATNFLGTTDAQDLVIKANNAEAIRVQSGGNVGIGTTTPASKLHIAGGIPAAANTQNFEAAAAGNITTVAGTNPYQLNINSGCVATDGWRISATDASFTPCTSCSGNRAIIDYGTSTCIQDATLVVGPYTATSTSAIINFLYSYNFGTGDAMTVTLYNETTSTVVSTLASINSDVSNINYTSGAITVVSGNTYSVRFRYQATDDYGASVDNVSITFSAISASVLRIADGSQATGKVLTSDASGNASWLAPAVATDSQTLSISGSNLSISGGNTVALPSNSYTFTNGLTNAAGTVKLGGTLTESTNINASSFPLSVSTTNKTNMFRVSNTDEMVYIGNSTAPTSDGISYSINGLGENIEFIAKMSTSNTRGTGIGTGSIEYIVDGESVIASSVSFLPLTDATLNLGSSSNRWNTVYSVNGTVSTSDAALKKDINRLNYGLKEILELKPVTFKWKDELTSTNQKVTDDTKTTKIGFLAQDLLKVIPEVVQTHSWQITDEKKPAEYLPNKNLGVFYSDLIPVAVKAIQEQQTQIEELKKAVEELKKQNELLLQLVSKK